MQSVHSYYFVRKLLQPRNYPRASVTVYSQVRDGPPSHRVENDDGVSTTETYSDLDSKIIQQQIHRDPLFRKETRQKSSCMDSAPGTEHFSNVSFQFQNAAQCHKKESLFSVKILRNVTKSKIRQDYDLFLSINT